MESTGSGDQTSSGLTRRRKQMVCCAPDERNRVQRVLQEANVQLGTVAEAFVVNRSPSSHAT
jgi:hypothetical protein